MCECRSARHLDPEDEHHVVSYEINNADGTHVVTVFPYEPSWWNDEDAEARRQEVFANFRQTDLVHLIDEIVMYVNNPPTDANEVVQLMQCLQSMEWMIKVCVGSLDYVSEDDLTTCWVRYWQQRAARYLAELAWNTVLIFPAEWIFSGERHCSCYEAD